MVSTRFTLAALLLAGSAVCSEASAFLQARAEDKYISKEDVERMLLSESTGVSDSVELRKTEEQLRPMFAALPKNSQGNLEPAVVRYAIHRFFVQQHGWYMLGLDTAGRAWNSTAPSNIMKDRAPAYIETLFEQRLQGRGFGLHELAVFAAVLSDLVHKEALGGLHKVYTSLRLPTVGPVHAHASEQAVKAYLMLYLVGGDLVLTDMSQFDILEEELLEIYPDWPGTYMWVEDFRRTYDMMRQSRKNPFRAPQPDTFESSVSFVQELGHNFGSFQDLECKALKGKLVDMEHQGTGRVRLSRFYAGGVKGDWTLSESVDYLRNLGALDETDPNSPSVVIPNYLTSQTNCLTASGFYSVCCSDECEGLRQRLETEIAAPSASPARVAQLVSALSSDTVDSPRNLSSTLLARLNEIAEVHAGSVPLHGRLFAQWLHHAYPRECPFPHVSGTMNPMSPDEWMIHHGIDNVEASMEEMQRHHSRLEQETLREEQDSASVLPWTHTEELVARHESILAKPRSWAATLLRIAMGIAALSSFAVPLVRASRDAVSSSSPSKEDRVLV